MITLSMLSLVAALLAQAQAQPPSAAAADRPADGPNESAARLAIMRRSLTVLTVHGVEDRGVAFRLLPEPIFRFTNPVGTSKDGAIFLWLGAGDRPEAAVQVFVRRDDQWVQEFTSLSPGPLIAEESNGPGWRPAQGGVEFKPVPDAPKPAASPEQRLRQIRALAEDFAALDHFQTKSWQRLRLLAKPLARYGKPGADPKDGALFSFVLGTDPEAYLMIEERTGTTGPEWQYAFAPMTTYALKGEFKGAEVWAMPHRGSPDRGANKTFHARLIEPEQ